MDEIKQGERERGRKGGERKEERAGREKELSLP